MPQDEKRTSDKEAAHFVNAGGGAIGTMDGVGGFIKYGISAQRMANCIATIGDMMTCQQPLTPATNYGGARNRAEAIALDAWEWAADDGPPGSTTLAIVALSLNWVPLVNKWAPYADTALFGDSGTGPNCPNQLQKWPPDEYGNFPLHPHPAELEKSRGLQVASVPVQPNDLILTYSDGLSDNLFEKEIVKPVNIKVLASELPFPAPPRLANGIARSIVDAAFRRSKTDETTPFELQHAGAWKGGKEDDITCTAAFVCMMSMQDTLTKGERQTPSTPSHIPTRSDNNAAAAQQQDKQRGAGWAKKSMGLTRAVRDRMT
ncbi:unnamed protein product [Vitrella brassicaformis CCMP3155]|uniref:Protein phosphatase n=1 Tax=Vitrella brassicaformis (strain CCMP3155) TaxID=1169540 RepID=A0A0G4EH11_VITBC|nr:unnamed protein product [Vitrella brassicaformis CCMP3155]|eukprot:CEL95527.1 unnamed protein product [Vitrella brassicaformis CCMP3155]